jgi:DNA polymerase-3 subunit beta
MDTNILTLKTSEFARELEWVARFIERKTTIPILQNVMLQKSGEAITLTGTDLETAGISQIQADNGAAEFALTMPVQQLLKYIKRIEESVVRLRVRHTYTSHWGRPVTMTPFAIVLEHGDDGVVSIPITTIDSYPELPARPAPAYEIGGLDTALPRAVVSIAKDESRFTLNGALLEVGDSARMISTDGHRLSVVDLETITEFRDAPADFKALVPKSALLELSRLGDSAIVCRNEHHVFFKAGHRTIVSRVLSGNFPDWQRVMPAEWNFSFDVPTQPTRKVVDRVSVFADERSRALAVTLNGALTLEASTHDAGSARGQVSITGPKLATPYRSGVSATYLSDFLKSAGDQMQWKVNRASTAGMLEAPGWRYVLMPMRLDPSSDPVAAVCCANCGADVLDALNRDACCDGTPRVAPAIIHAHDCICRDCASARVKVKRAARVRNPRCEPTPKPAPKPARPAVQAIDDKAMRRKLAQKERDKIRYAAIKAARVAARQEVASASACA